MTKRVQCRSGQEKPHVCFVSETPATYSLLAGEVSNIVGGAEVQQMLLSSELLRLGYTVTFLVPDCGQPAEFVTDRGIRVIKTRRQFRTNSNPLSVVGDIVRLFRAMRRAKADVYYQRAAATITGIIAAFCKLTRKPFVFSVAHNLDLDCDPMVNSSIGKRIYRYGLRNASRVVVQTAVQENMLKEGFGIEGNLIRSTFSKPEASGCSPVPGTVLWVGNLRPMRRPHMYLELATALPQFRFVMVGGPVPQEESLHQEIKTCAESVSNLKMTGAVPYREVGRYFDEAVLFVNTTDLEGFPNTYLQAWCRGIPVVGTFDPDGLLSRNGLGRHCSTVAEIAEAVNALMKDDEKRCAIGMDARRYVEEHHSPESVARDYDQLFLELWGRGSGTRP